MLIRWNGNSVRSHICLIDLARVVKQSLYSVQNIRRSLYLRAVYTKVDREHLRR